MPFPSPGESYYSWNVSPEERQRHKDQLSVSSSEAAGILEKRQREESEFLAQLDAANLADLLKLRRELEEDAAKTRHLLDKAPAKSLPSSIKLPAVAGEGYYLHVISNEDIDRLAAAARKIGVADLPTQQISAFIPLGENRNLDGQLTSTKDWLKETFPSKQTDALLVKTSDGENVIVALGVSSEEIATARSVQATQHRLQERTDAVTTQIRERVERHSAIRPESQGQALARAMDTPVRVNEGGTTIQRIERN